ncbi:hypothetical protein [Streptomyces sp. NBC_01497]|uniref:hypothetical protein n=1 Tax=Streptomyces sp. NBC_01497 TaxID=2903885 RepID=UPI002E316256|nr:hypothetical protein [Streptomyces sp. NBC_01497]
MDKALFGALTQQVPRLTQANYIDAVLAARLKGLQPFGTDLAQMEAEKDLVWSLAQTGSNYREYILGDRDAQTLPEQRPVCKLSADVNARFDRMIDIMKTMPGQLPVKPFEIVSACLAEYLQGLDGERQSVTAFFQEHVVTTVQ